MAKSTIGSSASARRSGAKGRTPRRTTERVETRANGIAAQTNDGPDMTEERHGGVVVAEHVAPADSTPLALVPPGGPATSKFSDNGGKVLQVVQVQLVYWGNRLGQRYRAGEPVDVRPITNAVRAMLASAYMTGLAEYRGIGRGSWAPPVNTSRPADLLHRPEGRNFVAGQSPPAPSRRRTSTTRPSTSS